MLFNPLALIIQRGELSALYGIRAWTRYQENTHRVGLIPALGYLHYIGFVFSCQWLDHCRLALNMTQHSALMFALFDHIARSAMAVDLHFFASSHQCSVRCFLTLLS